MISRFSSNEYTFAGNLPNFRSLFAGSEILINFSPKSKLPPAFPKTPHFGSIISISLIFFSKISFPSKDNLTSWWIKITYFPLAICMASFSPEYPSCLFSLELSKNPNSELLLLNPAFSHDFKNSKY